MAKRPKKPPRDPNMLAKLIVDIATGDAPDTVTVDGKDPAAVSLGKRGGKARAKSLTPEKRKAIAKKAAESRWKKDD
jgi:hypothetical protein